MDGTATRVTPREAVEALASLQVTVLNPEEVQAYLEQHDDMTGLLTTICTRARQEFGDEAELTLELQYDAGGAYPHLTLYVRLPSYDAGTMGRIDTVWEPYEEQLTAASGEFYVTTDHRMVRGKHGGV